MNTSASGKKKFTPVKPTQSDKPKSGTASSIAKKNVLKALNDQLKIRAKRLEERKGTPQKENPEVEDEIPSTSPVKDPSPEKPKSKIPISVKLQTKSPVPSSSPSIAALKEKCIARKFAQIWLRRTFGRVDPYVARQHYEKALLRRTFGEWYEEYWNEKVEWRLMIRAQCHDRYRHYRHIWRHWKQFVIMRRIKRAKYGLAYSHHETSLMSTVFSAWQQYVGDRQREDQLRRKADEFHDATLLQTCWAFWKEQQQLRGIYYHLDQVAIQFWATQALAKFWVQWKHAYEDEQLMKRKETLAIEHHNTVVRLRAMRVLKTYTEKRRQRREIKANVDLYYGRNLVRRYYQSWVRRRLTMSLVRHREDEIDESGRRFQLRRALEHWKFYIELQRQKLTKEVLADEQYREKLLLMGLTGLRLAVAQTNVQNKRKRLADEFNKTNVLRTAWRVWVSRCDQNEEIRTIPQRRIAQQHHETILLKSCMGQWRLYIEWRRHRRAQYIRADAYYVTKSLPRYLAALYDNAQLQIRNRRMAVAANDFYRSSALSRYLSAWVHQLTDLRERRTMMRMAILHYDDTLVARTFLQWKSRAEDASDTRLRMEGAEQRYLAGLMARVVRAWRGHARRARLERRHKIMAWGHCQSGMVERAWSKWKEAYEARRLASRHERLASDHSKSRLLRTVMGAWTSHTDECRRMRTIAEQKVREKNLELMRSRFLLWKERAVESRVERDNEQKALVHYYATSMRKVVREWREVACELSFKRARQDGQIVEAREVLDKTLVKAYFSRWCERRDQALLQRLKYQQASIHHARLVERRCLNAWRHFVQKEKDTALLRHQGVWFNSTRLLVGAFVQWKSLHEQRQEENEKSGVALWHWSLVLQSKVFSAWRDYSTERRRKKARWSLAMASRLDYLRTDAVRQWLTTASELQRMREKWTANQEATAVYKTQLVVRRCVNHWRQWAQRRRKHRAKPPDLTTYAKPFIHPARTAERRPYLLPPRDLKSAPVLDPPSSRPAVRPSVGPVPLKADQSHSPLVAAPRRKPRLPDFMLASVEAALLTRKEEKLLNIIEPPCYRLDEADLNRGDLPKLAEENAEQSEDADSSGPIINEDVENAPTIEFNEPVDTENRGTKLQIPETGGSGDAFSSPMKTGTVRDSTTIADSPSKHLILNGRKHYLSPSKAVLREKLTLMTPDMFLNPVKTAPANQTAGSDHVLSDLTNRRPVKRPGNEAVTVECEMTNIRNYLRVYRNRKSELSLLRSQASEMEQVLRDEHDQTIHDELIVLRADIARLEMELNEKKDESERLAVRARQLMHHFVKPS